MEVNVSSSHSFLIFNDCWPIRLFCFKFFILLNLCFPSPSLLFAVTPWPGTAVLAGDPAFAPPQLWEETAALLSGFCRVWTYWWVWDSDTHSCSESKPLHSVITTPILILLVKSGVLMIRAFLPCLCLEATAHTHQRKTKYLPLVEFSSQTQGEGTPSLSLNILLNSVLRINYFSGNWHWRNYFSSRDNHIPTVRTQRPKVYQWHISEFYSLSLCYMVMHVYACLAY